METSVSIGFHLNCLHIWYAAYLLLSHLTHMILF